MGWFSKSDRAFFLATVMPSGEGARIGEYLGVVNGEAIIGANIFRDMFSSVRDAALEDMKSAAKELGADGVVGIDFDYEVLGEANGMMMVSVSGTAVRMA
jgi:uncharacterized protein YbjQ (UPF0145 family)